MKKVKGFKATDEHSQLFALVTKIIKKLTDQDQPPELTDMNSSNSAKNKRPSTYNGTERRTYQ